MFPMLPGFRWPKEAIGVSAWPPLPKAVNSTCLGAPGGHGLARRLQALQPRLWRLSDRDKAFGGRRHPASRSSDRDVRRFRERRAVAGRDRPILPGRTSVQVRGYRRAYILVSPRLPRTLRGGVTAASPGGQSVVRATRRDCADGRPDRRAASVRSSSPVVADPLSATGPPRPFP